MKYLFFLVFLLFPMFLSCNSKDKEVVKTKLLFHVEEYHKAMNSGDSKNLIKYYPEELVNKTGGFDEFSKLLKSKLDDLHDNGFTYGNIEYSEVNKLSQDDDEIHALVPVKMKIYTPEKNILSNSHLYCFSLDNGFNWTILDYDLTKQAFPDFQYKFHPDIKSTSTEESCKYFMSDLLGNNVCIDRYIDTGKFEILEKEGALVTKLKKKYGVKFLESAQNKMIESEMKKWRDEAGIDFLIPLIYAKSVLYIESTLGRYYLYDIYGVPFTYSDSGKSVSDTFPGYFKHEYTKAFQTKNNIQIVIDQEDEFQSLYDPSDFQ